MLDPAKDHISYICIKKLYKLIPWWPTYTAKPTGPSQTHAYRSIPQLHRPPSQTHQAKQSNIYIYPFFSLNFAIALSLSLSLFYLKLYRYISYQFFDTQNRTEWENLVVTKKGLTKVLGLSKKTKSLLITSKPMVKAVGVPFPRLQVISYTILLYMSHKSNLLQIYNIHFS